MPSGWIEPQGRKIERLPDRSYRAAKRRGPLFVRGNVAGRISLGRGLRRCERGARPNRPRTDRSEAKNPAIEQSQVPRSLEDRDSVRKSNCKLAFTRSPAAPAGDDFAILRDYFFVTSPIRPTCRSELGAQPRPTAQIRALKEHCGGQVEEGKNDASFSGGTEWNGMDRVEV
jgi:hypothetical protein